MELSVVIPVYNEEICINPNLKKIIQYLENLKIDSEIIIVEDKSSDSTLSILYKLKRRHPQLRILKNNKNRGKGYSVKRGILAAKGNYILFSDADLSTPIEETRKFLEAMKNCDVAIGSRRIAGSNIIIKQPIYRIILGDVFSSLVRIFIIHGIKDTQCGFKIFRKEAAQKIFTQLTRERFSFDIEVLFLATLLNYRIKEIPVSWVNSHKSTVHPIKDSIKMLKDIAIIRFNHIKGDYKNEK